MSLSLKFTNTYLIGASSVAGPNEKDSIVSEDIDYFFSRIDAGQPSYEQGEIQMVKKALKILFEKCPKYRNAIDLALGGDLLDQCAISNHISKFLPVSFFSIYGACSSLILGMILGSYFVSNKDARNVINFSSSNFATAERQFRNPLEYGGQKKDSVTITSTGASAVLIGQSKSKIEVVSATIGRVYDVNWDNPSDLGSPMAYGAYHTIKEHLFKFHNSIDDYDLILTGDLSKIGSEVLKKMFESDGIIMKNYIDAGETLFAHSDKFFSGGSGCACIGLVSFSYVINKLIRGEINNCLLVGTGALFSPTLLNQKDSIPVVGHAIEIRRVR